MLAHETSGEARVSFASDRTSRVVVCHVRLVLSRCSCHSVFVFYEREREVSMLGMLVLGGLLVLIVIACWLGDLSRGGR